MAWQSTVPAAIDALVAAFTAAPALAGAAVYDGPQVTYSTAGEVVAVGFTGQRFSSTGAYPEAAEAVVENTPVVEGLSASRNREQYIIRNLAAVLNGDGDMSDARRRAYNLVAACGQAVAADPALGGSVMMATIGTTTYTPEQMQRGALATVMFQVQVEAYTQP